MLAKGKAEIFWWYNAYLRRDQPESPPWMTRVLWLAGLYNLAWGAFVVLWPLLPFRWAQMVPPNYPQIWQCVGMIVGVYGVGYIIAAHAPFKQWPIVLVGFIGKIFGPIGMAWSLWQQTLPPLATLVCATNDLIWWIPFGAILAGTFRHFRASHPHST